MPVLILLKVEEELRNLYSRRPSVPSDMDSVDKTHLKGEDNELQKVEITSEWRSTNTIQGESSFIYKTLLLILYTVLRRYAVT